MSFLTAEWRRLAFSYLEINQIIPKAIFFKRIYNFKRILDIELRTPKDEV